MKNIKISYMARTKPRRPTEFVPRIMLSGKWLAQAGFQIGDQVSIKQSGKKLIIECTEK